MLLKGIFMSNQVKFRPIFVTGTGTDVGKTYVTALLCKALKSHIEERYSLDHDHSLLERSVGYYKAAISGADCIEESDAGYINSFANLGQDLNSLTSYLYQEAVSPHLAQQHQGSEPISISKIQHDFLQVSDHSQLTVLEGSGGIYCPLCWNHEPLEQAHVQEQEQSLEHNHASAMMSCVEQGRYTIADFMKMLSTQYGLSIVVVGDAALGCINNVVMTLTSLKAEGFNLKDVSVIINNYDEHNAMHVDNVRMIEAMTKIPVIAKVAKGDTCLALDEQGLDRLLVKA